MLFAVMKYYKSKFFVVLVQQFRSYGPWKRLPTVNDGCGEQTLMILFFVYHGTDWETHLTLSMTRKAFIVPQRFRA